MTRGRAALITLATLPTIDDQSTESPTGLVSPRRRVAPPARRDSSPRLWLFPA